MAPRSVHSERFERARCEGDRRTQFTRRNAVQIAAQLVKTRPTGSPKLTSYRKDSRHVVADVRVAYFGGQIDDRSLVPDGDLARIGRVRFDEWIRRLAV